MSKIKDFLMKFDFKSVNVGAWVRLVLTLVSFANLILAKAGHAPVPASYEDVYMGVSIVFAFIVGLVDYWKNNSFTKGAQEADRFLHDKGAFDGGLTAEEAEIVKAELASRKISRYEGEENPDFED